MAAWEAVGAASVAQAVAMTIRERFMGRLSTWDGDAGSQFGAAEQRARADRGLPSNAFLRAKLRCTLDCGALTPASAALKRRLARALLEKRAHRSLQVLGTEQVSGDLR